ncbi:MULTISPECIES: hypothetical protein [unclassified Arthrobacter]|uniref:hypothetical protein n=1 Tax=unclassified Arthrobacter TaxID=235627 RepID=UPI000CE32E5F|nr:MULTISPECIES: hypothetical protein [unclassified Arthrobacter]
MALAFLRTKYGRIDLRQPLYIAVDGGHTSVVVMHDTPRSGAGGQVVAELKNEGQSGNNISQLHAIADSLANAIAYANAYVAKTPEEGTAWMLSFEPVGDSYWTMNRADENPGVTPVYHIK